MLSAVAEEIAEYRGESLVTSPERLPPDEPVIYVDDPEEIDDKLLLRLQERQLSGDPKKNAFGIITGYTPESARELYFDDHDYDDGHLLLSKHHDLEITDPDSTVLTHDQMDVDTVRSNNEGGSTSLTLLTPGWPIHLYLEDGYICGFPESQTTESFPDDNQPYCVADGEMDCPLNGDILHAEQLCASHVFVGSCASLIDNNNTGLPVHVGYGLLKGADSVIGSYRVAANDPSESSLHYALLRAGYSAAERVYLLNRNSHSKATKAYPHVLFGRPNHRLSEATEGRSEVDFEQTSDGARVTIDRAAGYVLDVTVPGSYFDSQSSGFLVRSGDDTPVEPNYYSVFREGEDVRLLLYQGSHFDVENSSVEVVPEASISKDFDVVRESIHNSYRVQLFDLNSTRTTNQTSELRKRLSKVSSNYYGARRKISQADELAAQVRSLANDVSRIHDELRVKLAKDGDLMEIYAHCASEREVYVSDMNCRRCGHSIYVKRVTDGAWQFSRLIGFCPTCSYRLDVPSHSSHETPPRPKVTGSLLDQESAEMDFQVHFENDTSTHKLTTIFPWVTSVDYEESGLGKHVTPESVTKTLAPGERMDVSFELNADLLVDNEYKLFAYVISNVEMYLAYEPFIVGDSPGYRPLYLQ